MLKNLSIPNVKKNLQNARLACLFLVMLLSSVLVIAQAPVLNPLPLDIGDTITLDLGPMISWYPFNHDVNDYSGNNLNATNNGALPSPDAPCPALDSAYRFPGYSSPGSGSNIVLPHTSLYNSFPLTISVWMKKNNNFIQHSSGGVSIEGIFIKDISTSNSVGFFMFLYNETPPFKIGFGVGIGTAQAGIAGPSNIQPYTWQHFVGVVEQNKLTLYQNGQRIDTLNLSTTPATNSYPITLGKVPTNGTDTRFFVGNMDDFRIYGRALNACEVKYLYGTCHPRLLNVSFHPDVCQTDIANIGVVNPEPGISYQLVDAQTLTPVSSAQTSSLCDTILYVAGLTGLTTGQHTYKIHALNITTGNERYLDTTISLTVHPNPAINLGNDTSLCGNSVLILNPGAGFSTYLWQNGSNQQTFQVSTTGTYWVKVTDQQGCKTTDSIHVITYPYPKISGHLKYFNSTSTPLDITKILLKNELHQLIDSTYTDNSGYYSFTGPSASVYYIEPVINKLPGGFNADDAFKVLKHFVRLDTLSGLYFRAGDVNASLYVNSVDAILILDRFAGFIDTFQAGDWVYDNEPVINTASCITHDISVLCVGDVDASYIPPACTPPPSVANAGSDQLNIPGTSANLHAGALLPGETGTWSILTGSCGNISNIHNPLSTFTGAPGNSYTLRWTIQTQCGSTSDDVTISFMTGFTCGTNINYGGQTYHTLQIGCQCWIRENLNIGTMISGTNNQTNNGTIEKYCWNGLSSNCTTYGGLYQWDEMMQYTNTPGARGICPDFFRLPMNEDWCLLATTVDPSVNCNQNGFTGTSAGGVLKETGTIHWLPPNMGATNTSGFTALGSGWRQDDGTFDNNLSRDAYFATSSENGPSTEWYWSVDYNQAGINHSSLSKTYGFSVRCIRDTCLYSPSQSSAGPNQNVGGTSTTLAGNTPVHGNGLWTILSGTGGVISDPSNPTSAFFGSYGNYTLSWTITTSCGSSSANVTITFNCVPQPDPANAGPNQNVSGTSTSLAANTPSAGTGLWTIISGSGGIIADSTNPQSLFSGIYGTYTLQWTITTVCGSSSANVIIAFAPVPGLPCPGVPTVVYGSKTYNTVQVGNQCWLKENLNIGVQIPNTEVASDNGIIEKYCYNNDTANCSIYGGLYQWDEMMQYTQTEGAQGICPSGWHIPTDAEWCTMATFLFNSMNCTLHDTWTGGTVGLKFKESGTTHWNVNTGATNLSGFTALGAGDYNTNTPGWERLKTDTWFQTSTQISSTTSYNWALNYIQQGINRRTTSKSFSTPVRCLMN